MQNYNWQIDNFALGMHTEPAKTQGGERYAAEIQNLRVDSDGWLRERSAVQALGPNGANITGVGVSSASRIARRKHRQYSMSRHIKHQCRMSADG